MLTKQDELLLKSKGIKFADFEKQLADFKTGKGHFLTLSALMGFLQPEKTNFQYLFGMDACYRNTFFISPSIVLL